MKQPIKQQASKRFVTMIILLLMQVSAFAQEKVEVNGNDVGTWFKNNWMWIGGVVILLLLILLFSGGKNRRKSTTIVKDNYGDVKRVTTTETEE
jgi:hypothetical protein